MRKSKDVPAAAAFRVLVFDSNRNGLLARKSVLEEHGFLVDAYLGSEDALAAFQTGAHDLVITDYKGPNSKSADMIVRLKEIRPTVPVVLLSAMVDPLGLNEQNTGANAVVAKSANELQYLLRAVRRLLQPASKKPPASQALKRPRKQQNGSV